MFVFFRLTIRNLVEYAWPKATLAWRSFSRTKSLVSCLQPKSNSLEQADMPLIEQQSKKEKYSSFRDFDEVLITHGYGVLFAVASPWVTAAVLLATILEIILDAHGIMEQKQRPIPTKVRNNDPWDMAFDIYGVIAAFTNVILLIFGSDLYDDWSLTEKLVLCVLLEHVVFFGRIVLRMVFPATPRS